MTDTLDSTGLHIDDLLTRLDALSAKLRVAISSTLDLSAEQPWGQLTQIVNEHHQQLAELLQEVYAGIDPDQASGATLDGVCSITGTHRRAATYGTVSLYLDFSAAGTVPAGSIVAVAGDPDNQWAIDEDVVASHSGSFAGAATSLVLGDMPAVAHTITVIVTPVASWIAVVNNDDASAGLEVETDTELRLRRELELVTGGSTSVDAIQAAVSPIVGVLEVACVENSSWRAVAPMPPKSIEVIFWSTCTGGALTDLEALIATEVFEEKAGGIQAYGTTEITHTDNQGNDHQIGMTLATERILEMRYTLTTDDDYPGDVTFSAEVAAAASALTSIGETVRYNKMIDIGFNVAGVVDITALDIRFSGDSWGVVNLPVGQREKATCVAADVAVL